MGGKREIKVVKSAIMAQYAQSVISTILGEMGIMVKLRINVNYAILTKLFT